MRTAGVVLVGGRSSRMGSPKAGLNWHGSTLLRRVSGLVARAVDGPVIVVRAPDQPLPAPAPGVLVVADPTPGWGPLVGLATGLRAAADAGAELAFCCATDLPFLHPAYVRRVLALLAATPGAELLTPHLDGHPQPLAAAYRTAIGTRLAELAEGGERRVRTLGSWFPAREVGAAELLADPELAAADPELRSVRGVNSPADHAAALAEPPPAVTVWWRGRSYPLAAATLLGAARAAGAPLPPGRDAEEPLATGDEIRI